MKIAKVSEIGTFKNPHGIDARKLMDLPKAQVVHMKLGPGDSLKKHITPVDVFFYVLEGEGAVEIGDEKIIVGTDTLIESPANIPHAWYNESRDTLRFLVIKLS
jgi:mannose-6-phosphate isomerase-like protein (cupin superfamily)